MNTQRIILSTTLSCLDNPPSSPLASPTTHRRLRQHSSSPSTSRAARLCCPSSIVLPLLPFPFPFQSGFRRYTRFTFQETLPLKTHLQPPSILHWAYSIEDPSNRARSLAFGTDLVAYSTWSLDCPSLCTVFHHRLKYTQQSLSTLLAFSTVPLHASRPFDAIVV